jgi:hypothetical protein
MGIIPLSIINAQKMARFVPHPAIIVQLCPHGHKQRARACQGKYLAMLKKQR